MEKLVCAIIVNYNGADDTNACVDSLLRSSYKNLKIIIVDNNSTTGKVKYNNIITREKCEILYQEENLGFAGANNVGIRYAMELKSAYILIINNDTVVTQGFLTPLIEICDLNDKVGIATGKIFYYDDRDVLWFGGSYYDKKRCEFKIDGIGRKEENRHNQRREIPFATGCLWLVPTKVFETVGLMREDYFLYYEDADYCERVKQSGYRIMYEPDSVIYHKESRSTKRGSDSYQYYNIRNYLIYTRRFCKIELKIIMYINKFLYTLKEVIRGRLRLKVFIRAWSDFLALHYGKME